MKLQEVCKTCMFFTGRCCQVNMYEDPTPVESIKICPQFILPDGKYALQHIRSVIRKDPTYIKDLIAGNIDFDVSIIRDITVFKEQLQILVQDEIEKATTYLATLKEL